MTIKTCATPRKGVKFQLLSPYEGIKIDAVIFIEVNSAKSLRRWEEILLYIIEVMIQDTTIVTLVNSKSVP